MNKNQIEEIENAPIHRAVPPLTGCYFGTSCFTYSLR
ncbi:MAG: hypothetical protein QOE90_2748 [Thermoplasmata archaeon]|jgi:hypothetical protein|nr:hypothetical protein [Thermoplasmata archaeon]